MTQAPKTSALDDETGMVAESTQDNGAGRAGKELESAVETPQHIPVIEITDPKKELPVGMLLNMTVNVRCQEACDLRGGTILIGDADNHVVAEETLVAFDEKRGLSSTDSFSVQVPREPGDYTWTIVFYPFEDDTSDTDVGYEGEEAEQLPSDDASAALLETPVSLHAIVQTEYHFKAIQHITGMSVWRNTSETVPVGSDYELNIGISCIHGCSLLGQTVNIYCDGSLLASAVMEEPKAPLESLYQNTLTLAAPSEVGMSTLECRLEPQGLDLSHTSDTRKYILTTNKHAQCRLDLLVLNEEEGTPIGKASIVVRPKDGYPGYSQVDAEGKTSIGVPWGDIHIGVNLRGYLEVETDISIPEGQEVYELTMKMFTDPSLFG